MSNTFPFSFESQLNILQRDVCALSNAILKADFADYDQYLLIDLIFEKALRLCRKPSLILYAYLVADKLFSLSSFPAIHRIFGSVPIENPKTAVLSLKSFVYLTKAGLPQYQQSVIQTANRIVTRLARFGKDCSFVASPFRHWYDFKRNLCYNQSSANIYLTALCGKALLSAAEIDHAFLTPATEIANFLMLPQCYIKQNYQFFYKYFVGDDALLVHNANTTVGSFLVQVSRRVRDGLRYGEIGRSALKSTLEEISEDGCLPYFSKADIRYSPRIVDNFHTGFVICDLIDAIACSKHKTYYRYISKLLSFYSIMFDRSGCPSHTPWRRFPIDIHDCAVGILTFSKASCMSEQFLYEAYKIYECTRRLLQDDDGLYFYQRYPLFRHRGKFLRWNQVWMLVALSALIHATVDKAT